MEIVNFIYRLANSNPKLTAGDVVKNLTGSIKTGSAWVGSLPPKFPVGAEVLSIGSAEGANEFVWVQYGHQLADDQQSLLKTAIASIEGTGELFFDDI
jgi:hypothetical protein